MATYKVLQDIEAEDKLLGPLTLKQFIFAAIFIGLCFIGFTMLTSSAPGFLKIPFSTLLLPPMMIFGFMAAPIGRDQPNDLWLLARLRYLFKPRKRTWSQDGIKELVTITVPKRSVHKYTDGLDQEEVHSRLQALANTMDSRGWAVKNVNTNLFSQPGYLSSGDSSDRLVAATTLPQQDIAPDVQASDDILDEQNNKTAQHFDQLVKESSQAHRSQALDTMQGKQSPQQQTQDYWFMNQAQEPTSLPRDYSMFNGQSVVHPGTNDPADVRETDEEKEFAHRLVEEHKKQMGHVSDHMRTLQPLHDRDGNIIVSHKDATDTDDSTPIPGASNYHVADKQVSKDKKPNPAIADLARNDDLNITTIARQANKSLNDDGEVVVNLH